MQRGFVLLLVSLTAIAANGEPLQQPAPEASHRSAYDRPAYQRTRAGMATWTGKLERNATLTITGGTPSTGVLNGSGLPGVPVRLVIDQTNLAIAEMPAASNDYRRLVLKSHSRHNKIVIHWTVVGQ